MTEQVRVLLSVEGDAYLGYRKRWEETAMAPHLTYRDIRPVVLPADLSALSAELNDVVRLPGRLDWSAKKEYDPASEQDLRSLYVRVIQEASSPADFTEYLNRTTLRNLWPTLNVGRHLAAAWEERFPELRQAAG